MSETPPTIGEIILTNKDLTEVFSAKSSRFGSTIEEGLLRNRCHEVLRGAVDDGFLNLDHEDMAEFKKGLAARERRDAVMRKFIESAWATMADFLTYASDRQLREHMTTEIGSADLILDFCGITNKAVECEMKIRAER